MLRDSCSMDLHCATKVFPELCKLGISEPSGLLAAFRSAHEELEFSTIFFAHGPEVLAALAEPDAPHSRKAAAAAEKQDLTLMQPLLPEPAFLLSTS